MNLDDTRICVVGLGYVGLPLTLEFASRYPTLGFDINETRISELCQGFDSTLESPAEDFARAEHVSFTSSQAQLADCNVYIVTVPTPINEHRQPDLTPLRKASELIGSVISKGDVVVYESTVYPGATEEYCVPIIAERSGLEFNVDFFAGYSPERINPGDKEHRLPNILKITSGSTQQTAAYVDTLYSSIITAGTYAASSIRVAEAAKVIENTQRDLNIALMNELSLIFDQLELDTLEVLEAAGTKWNFLPFRPGLVGGHCIGVDPYYLTHKAQAVGLNPEVILAGRRTNDQMGAYIAERVVKLMARNKINIVASKVLVLGFTFKENCPDVRNTKVIDVITALQDYALDVDVYDPWADHTAAQSNYGVELVDAPLEGAYQAVVLAVAHDEFVELGIAGIQAFGRPDAVVFDVKSVLPKEDVDGRL